MSYNGIMEDKLNQEQPLKQEAVQQAVKPKKDNLLALKIIYGLVIFVVLVFFFILIQMLPSCKEECSAKLSAMEVLCMPILLVISALAAETIVNKSKNIEEKPIEEPSKKVSLDVLFKAFLGSSIASIIICGIPNLIFLGILDGRCESHDYSSCGAGLIAAYYFFFFPLIAAGTVYGSYKLSYLAFVPLRSIGTFPNGKEIMKHVTPIWARIATMGFSLVTVISILVLILTIINS